MPRWRDLELDLKGEGGPPIGDRLDHPATVHDINILSVIASESYTDFVGGLQKEIAESLSARPRKASQAYFVGKQLNTPEGLVTVWLSRSLQVHRPRSRLPRRSV